MSQIASATKFTEQILNSLRDIQREAISQSKDTEKSKDKDGGMSFADHLQKAIQEVNQKSHTADKMGMEMATGKAENIHETMLAATQAELSFNLMVQLRNKALEAYSEIMRMPV